MEPSTHLGNGHGPDFLNVDHAVVPGHQALHVDVQLVPQGQDSFIVLLNPTKQAEAGYSHTAAPAGSRARLAHWVIQPQSPLATQQDEL